jgi:hypothetical protein
MAGYKTDQCRIAYRGKEFHFVSYEGQGANPAKGVVETPAMWYLMRAGHRHEVMPQVTGQEVIERERQFGEWLESFVFDPPLDTAEVPTRRSA